MGNYQLLSCTAVNLQPTNKMTLAQKIELASILCPALYALGNSPDLPAELKQPTLDQANALYNFLQQTAALILA